MAPNGTRIFGFAGVRPVSVIVDTLQEVVSYVRSRSVFQPQLLSYTRTPQKIPTTAELLTFIASYINDILKLYDPVYGGFGRGQKFPQPRTLDFVLDLYQKSHNRKWLNMVENTLKNQYTEPDELKKKYKLFDPIEGGFHRYGMHRDWSSPHYEKMLYDNARLLMTYRHLLVLDADDELTKEVVRKTDNNHISLFRQDR